MKTRMIRAIRRWFQRPKPIGQHVAGQRAVAVHVIVAGRTTRGLRR